jgi:ATP-dependent protease HslVU (ClpYQ) peptidase subunit
MPEQLDLPTLEELQELIETTSEQAKDWYDREDLHSLEAA